MSFHISHCYFLYATEVGAAVSVLLTTKRSPGIPTPPSRSLPLIISASKAATGHSEPAAGNTLYVIVYTAHAGHNGYYKRYNDVETFQIHALTQHNHVHAGHVGMFHSIFATSKCSSIPIQHLTNMNAHVAAAIEGHPGTVMVPRSATPFLWGAAGEF